MKHSLDAGLIDSAITIYEGHYSPAISDVFYSLNCGVFPKDVTAFPDEVQKGASNNEMPDIVQGHRNVITNPPAWFADVPDFPPLPLPTRKPCFQGIPENYILFSDGAGAGDRILTDPELLCEIKNVTALPVIRIGQDSARSGMGWIPGADLDLSNRLHISEAFWLAANCSVVVAALSLWRVVSSLLGKHVIELGQDDRLSKDTIARTKAEYEGRSYGMTPQMNRWFRWPSEKDAALELISRLATADARNNG